MDREWYCHTSLNNTAEFCLFSNFKWMETYYICNSFVSGFFCLCLCSLDETVSNNVYREYQTERNAQAGCYATWAIQPQNYNITSKSHLLDATSSYIIRSWLMGSLNLCDWSCYPLIFSYICYFKAFFFFKAFISWICTESLHSVSPSTPQERLITSICTMAPGVPETFHIQQTKQNTGLNLGPLTLASLTVYAKLTHQTLCKKYWKLIAKLFASKRILQILYNSSLQKERPKKKKGEGYFPSLYSVGCIWWLNSNRKRWKQWWLIRLGHKKHLSLCVVCMYVCVLCVCVHMHACTHVNVCVSHHWGQLAATSWRRLSSPREGFT